MWISLSTFTLITFIKEDKKSLILFVNKRQGMLIPKKEFTIEELNEIKKLLKTN